MGGFLDGFEVGNKKGIEDGVRFYSILDIGRGILEESAYRLKSIFGENRILVLYGKRKSKEFGKLVESIVGKPHSDIICVVSVGGGSIIDKGKFLAKNMGAHFVSIPTLISSDGIASPIGVKYGRSFYIELPFGVIVDIDIVGNAPRWSILAGTGDLLSDLSASIDWDRFKEKSSEPYSFISSLICKSSALSMLNFNPFKNPESLVWGLILSGWAMSIAGSSRPASGPEHKLSHSLDLIGFGEKHGIQVGFFTPLFLKLNGYDKWNDVRKYLTNLGFPEKITLKKEQAYEVFSRASSTRPHRWTIIEELGWEKVLEAAVDMGFIELV